jgi:hypothetical protein
MSNDTAGGSPPPVYVGDSRDVTHILQAPAPGEPVLPTKNWALANGDIPPGLELTQTQPGSPVLQGTPGTGVLGPDGKPYMVHLNGLARPATPAESQALAAGQVPPGLTLSEPGGNPSGQSFGQRGSNMSWNPGTTAQQLNLDLPRLNGIIETTNQGVVDMKSLNTQVLDAADAVLQHMASDPGQIVHRNLANWCANFAKITNDLGALNDRVSGMRSALVSANADAGATAAVQPGVLTPNLTHLT